MKKTKENQTSIKQVEAFRKKARELGCDEDPKAFERAFSKVVPPKNPANKAKTRQKRKEG
ncbi:MAG: hypothetical protein WBF40_09090 [Methyloceanibacter sp.]